MRTLMYKIKANNIKSLYKNKYSKENNNKCNKISKNRLKIIKNLLRIT
jgi:hypothetical protein